MPAVRSKPQTKKKTAIGANPFFEVRKSSIQGRGAFATRAIRKGQRIIEYTGERISDTEADRRYDESQMKRHHTFLFTVTPSIDVDGAIEGNESIYINHSCEPNCEAVIDKRRIYIEALRTIQPGEELGYDYQFERTGDEEEDKKMEAFYKCLCGSPNCRGSILVPPKPPRKKKTVAKKSGAKKKSKRSPVSQSTGAARKKTNTKRAAKKTKRAAKRGEGGRQSSSRRGR